MFVEFFLCAKLLNVFQSVRSFCGPNCLQCAVSRVLVCGSVFLCLCLCFAVLEVGLQGFVALLFYAILSCFLCVLAVVCVCSVFSLFGMWCLSATSMALVSIFVAVCTLCGLLVSASVFFNFLRKFLLHCFIVVCVGSAVLLDFVVCLCFVGDQDWQMI